MVDNISLCYTNIHVRVARKMIETLDPDYLHQRYSGVFTLDDP